MGRRIRSDALDHPTRCSAGHSGTLIGSSCATTLHWRGRRRFWARGLLLAIALLLVGMAADGTTHVYRLGNWPAPFGIVLVLDRLSALMVLLTATLAFIVLIHAIATGWMRGADISTHCSSSN